MHVRPVTRSNACWTDRNSSTLLPLRGAGWTFTDRTCDAQPARIELVPDEPQAEPSVGELLRAEIDATCQRVTLELDRLERLCRQLTGAGPVDLAVIATMRVGNTEIEDRVHANPLDGGIDES
jgi:hypothetical protein